MNLKVRHGEIKITKNSLKSIQKRLVNLKEYIHINPIELNRHDDNGNMIYSKFLPTGLEFYWDYDDNGKCIHFKSSNTEKWYTYDENGNCTYCKDTLNGREWRRQ